jgi:hypothetical protein
MGTAPVPSASEDACYTMRSAKVRQVDLGHAHIENCCPESDCSVFVCDHGTIQTTNHAVILLHGQGRADVTKMHNTRVITELSDLRIHYASCRTRSQP